jgi:hypothetical protein
LKLAHIELSDLNGSKNTLLTTTPNASKRQSAANSSIQTYNDDNDEIDLFDDDILSDSDLGNKAKLMMLNNNLTNVYIAPSAGDRAEARRASMKLKKAKQSLINIPPKAEINEFTKLDDIPNIDDTSNCESSGGGVIEDSEERKLKNIHLNRNDMLY